jgi:hypothetical protein
MSAVTFVLAAFAQHGLADDAPPAFAPAERALAREAAGRRGR